MSAKYKEPPAQKPSRYKSYVLEEPARGGIPSPLKVRDDLDAEIARLRGRLELLPLDEKLSTPNDTQR